MSAGADSKVSAARTELRRSALLAGTLVAIVLGGASMRLTDHGSGPWWLLIPWLAAGLVFGRALVAYLWVARALTHVEAELHEPIVAVGRPASDPPVWVRPRVLAMDSETAVLRRPRLLGPDEQGVWARDSVRVGIAINGRFEIDTPSGPVALAGVSSEQMLDFREQMAVDDLADP